MGPDDARCTCGAPIVCVQCEACPEHCQVGDPDRCYRELAAYVAGEGGPPLDVVRASALPHGDLRGHVAPEPPRWPKR